MALYSQNRQDGDSESLPFVTVVIPMRNEESNIARCLNSVLANDYSRDHLEILVMDGMSEDGSADVVYEFCQRFSFIRLLANPKRIQAAAMNIGVQESRGDIIIRMDAHSTYDEDYISRCVELLQRTDAANVGGVQEALGTNYWTRAVSQVTTSRFGIGDAKFRYAKRDMWVDTVYLGAWWKRAIEAVGGFDESLPVNEDYEFNYRLREHGGKILYSPRIASSYRVRGSFWGLARQYARYGFWKVRTLSLHPDSLRWRQLAPPVFVISLLASLALIPFMWQLAIVSPVLYLTYTSLASRRIAKRRRYLPIVPIVLMTIHLSWGAGFLAGIAKWGLPRWRPGSIAKSFKDTDLEVGI